MKASEAIVSLMLPIFAIKHTLLKAKEVMEFAKGKYKDNVLKELIQCKEGNWPFRKTISWDRALEIFDGGHFTSYGIHGEYYNYSWKASRLRRKYEHLCADIKEVEKMINIYSELEYESFASIGTETWLDLTEWTGRYQKEKNEQTNLQA